MAGSDGGGVDGGDVPEGWVPEESTGDVRAWLGTEERVVCRQEGDGWTASVQPRSELGVSHEVRLTDGPVSRDRAVEAAVEYMRGDADG